MYATYRHNNTPTWGGHGVEPLRYRNICLTAFLTVSYCSLSVLSAKGDGTGGGDGRVSIMVSTVDCEEGEESMSKSSAMIAPTTITMVTPVQILPHMTSAVSSGGGDMYR